MSTPTSAAATRTEPAVVIFDLDGVVRHWDRSVAAAAEECHGLPVGCIEAEAFAASRSMPAITGSLTDEQWRSAIATALVARYGPAARRAVEESSAPCGNVNLAVLELVRQQRAARRVALFTNATSRLGRDLAVLGPDTEFDVVFNSSNLGVAKPDERAFRAVIAALGRRPGECLFIDDTDSHVSAAARVGAEAHRFHSATSLAAILPRTGPQAQLDPARPAIDGPNST